jgi:tetratricopeptide (TPR) repeat protein
MERIANLAEMTALTGAVTSPGLESDVKLRRASASRAIEDFDIAVDLAGQVRETAVELGDLDLELRACLELGQGFTRCALGEGYWPLTELDLDPPDQAYTRALEIARETGDRAREAMALRELAVIEGGRARKVAVEAVQDGASKFDVLAMGPTIFAGAKELAEQAFKIFEEIGDQRGAMSALISMAYSHITDPTAHGMAGRIEHIRALHNSRKGQVTDTQRTTEDALMLYSIHTYARLNAQPDLALERGREAFEAARTLGDRWLEALAAGGLSLAYASFGGNEDSSAWLERAATAAMTVPSTSMARRVAMWRGACASARGDAEEVKRYYEQAAELAGTKNAAGRAEALCALAIESCKLWATNGEPALLDRARKAAEDTLEAVRLLPGGTPWESVAHSVMAVVADQENRPEDAADEARIALSTLDGLTHILHFINVLWAAGRVLVGQQAPETEALTHQIAQGLGYLSMNMTNPEIRARWFGVETHRELTELAGFEITDQMAGVGETVDLADNEMELLREITSGSEDTEASEGDIEALLSKLGVSTETEAIEYAIKAGITWQ